MMMDKDITNKIILASDSPIINSVDSKTITPIRDSSKDNSIMEPEQISKQLTLLL